MHFTTLIAAASDSTCHNKQIRYKLGCTGEGKGATPTQTEANQREAWNAQMQFMEMLYLSFCEATERN